MTPVQISDGLRLVFIAVCVVLISAAIVNLVSSIERHAPRITLAVLILAGAVFLFLVGAGAL